MEGKRTEGDGIDIQCRMGPRMLKDGKGASRSSSMTIYVPVAVAPLKLSCGADCASKRAFVLTVLCSFAPYYSTERTGITCLL